MLLLVSFQRKQPPCASRHSCSACLLADIYQAAIANELTNCLEEVVLHVDLDLAVALGVGDAGEDCKDARREWKDMR